jgi:hypothetical protein
MRKYFKSYPNASDLDLQNAWLNGADSELKTNTCGQGKVTKYAAANPASPIVIKSYKSCY